MTNDMDTECIALCEAMNSLPGIETIGSCCGHGKTEFRIWFIAESLEVLPPLLYWFAACHCGFYDWQVIVTTDCAKQPVHFHVECIRISPEAYEQATVIASLIEAHELSPTAGQG